ncbi:MAG: sigma-70 family RNA polymerase sigma factor [Phycisphaerae bacterium]|nr:sigma-70 family RNA polymerase sigma factor [Phycisphaerae bacterium]
MSYESDASLVDACARGDRRAWDVLVTRYSRLVWSIPRKYGLPESDCEDVHQTVFSALVRHIDELRQRERLASWLITTATRECWRLRRSTRTRAALTGEHGSAAEDLPAVPLPETDRDEEERQLVREGLATIGERCRDLLTALFAAPANPHYPEIAERLGIPIGSIGPNRARCLEKLEAILRGLGVRRAAE